MIVCVPNEVLTSAAKSVPAIDKKILETVELMKKNLVEKDNPKGVGLAAPQIGIGLRIFITRPSDESAIDVFINPEILEKSEELAEIERTGKSKGLKKEKKLEGCLSIPNVWGYLKRSKKVKMKYQDIEGKEQTREFSGFMATIVQHETDHLNGILFTQRVLEQKQKLYRIEETDKDEERLVEIEI
ncbi:MAG: methionyl-tRNA formyltransferase, methionyl-tRNA formyltransferase [Candidatus Gottesmanbacteria bacterium GW2011_GWA2_43_14]|uniref:Peptide deformylase n=1 Tax=Candidatus Gottesmanbacteria bacterium GW2011_GWA2_43_14 TaxID=1618443 RepID=A0A0G1DCN7_9BACT|nr:MAG: methionyl-tRNA formyltransferase, methionyl-tRNA formyltransferase [Candidatus Gottesmanbacteria bacterium GW2011_GWA2_43_14]